MSGSMGNVKHLDTKKFSTTTSTFKSGVAEYNSIKQKVERTTNTLLAQWSGEGKKQFEKDYTVLYRQLTDIADIMGELYDMLVEAEANYIKADEEIAKMMTIEE